MTQLSEISQKLQMGNAKGVIALVEAALGEGIPAQDILQNGLLDGMNVIGEKFKKNEVFVPEVLMSARAMKQGIELLKPHLTGEGTQSVGKVCIGTVRGDLHDIGKNLVKIMLEGKGFEVIDLGTDVAPETFIESAIENKCDIICCSALLTTTMPVMKEVIEKAKEAGIRDQVKIMVGGAPVNEEFAKQIGADAYTLDAASAAETASAFCKA